MRSAPPPKTTAQACASLVEAGLLEADASQAELAGLLDNLSDRISAGGSSGRSGALGRIFVRKGDGTHPRGLYVHGGVGTGKTMLMDMFFALAPGPAKRRMHFNEFMQEAHERIHRHRRDLKTGLTNLKDPIPPVAKAIAAKARLLCFDEFAVSDIADAMILGRLFSVMFGQGVCVVATSNMAPDELYRDGLNRQLFLPFIELLKRHTRIFELVARKDFRLGKPPRNRTYLSPLSPATASAMDEIWRDVTQGRQAGPTRIALKGRELDVALMAGRAARFQFGELCSEARGSEDYLAIAGRFDAVMIENIPMMDLSRRNEAKRFILLIDTLYDRGVRTLISAAANPHALYSASGGVERTEFQRTASRLIEMQSADWQHRRRGSADAAQTIA